MNPTTLKEFLEELRKDRDEYGEFNFDDLIHNITKVVHLALEQTRLEDIHVNQCSGDETHNEHCSGYCKSYADQFCEGFNTAGSDQERAVKRFLGL